MSEQEQLPAAAEIIVDDQGLKFPRPTIEMYNQLEEGDTLVLEEDALKKAHIWHRQGVTEGRESKKEEVEQLIRDKFYAFKGQVIMDEEMESKINWLKEELLEEV